MKTIPLDELLQQLHRLPLRLPISMGGPVHSGPSLQVGVQGTEVFILPVPEVGFDEQQARLLARYVAHATSVVPELVTTLTTCRNSIRHAAHCRAPQAYPCTCDADRLWALTQAILNKATAVPVP